MAAAVQKIETPKPAPVVRLAEGIATKLADAKSELQKLGQQVGNVRLDAEIDAPGGAARLKQLDQQLDAARRQVSQLAAAHEVAVLRDQRAAEVARHQIRLRSEADFKAAVTARQEAVDLLAKALATATTAYRTFVERNQSLQHILPLDVHLNRDLVAASVQELKPDVLVAMEMYRIGVTFDPQRLPVTGFALPGARAGSIDGVGDPSTIAPLTQQVRVHSEWLLDTVRDRVAALDPEAKD